MPENKSCHNCTHERAENPCMGCVKYEKWKPRQPETEKRVFEGRLELFGSDLVLVSDNRIHQHFSGMMSEIPIGEKVRITVEVLK